MAKRIAAATKRESPAQRIRRLWIALAAVAVSLASLLPLSNMASAGQNGQELVFAVNRNFWWSVGGVRVCGHSQDGPGSCTQFDSGFWHGHGFVYFKHGWQWQGDVRMIATLHTNVPWERVINIPKKVDGIDVIWINWYA